MVSSENLHPSRDLLVGRLKHQLREVLGLGRKLESMEPTADHRLRPPAELEVQFGTRSMFQQSIGMLEWIENEFGLEFGGLCPNLTTWVSVGPGDAELGH